MELECWFYGDSPDKTFFVLIPPKQPVASLKRSIKYVEPVRFHDVDPDELDLYSVPCPEENHFEDELKQLTLKDKTRLEPRTKVFKLRECLIIINPPGCADPPVIVPVMTLNCGMRGKRRGRVFPIEVPRTVTVGFLQQVIRNKEGRSINAKSLALYKVSIPYDNDHEEALKSITLDEDKPLNAMTILSDAFSNDPVQGHIHIIVKVLSILSHQLVLSSPSSRRLKACRRKFLNGFPLEAPSPTWGRGPLIERQEDPKRAIYCNRPHSAMAVIPVTLLHPVFGQFLDDCETYDPTPDDNSLTLDLQTAMSEHYFCENGRAKELREVFAEWDFDFDTPRADHSSAYGMEDDMDIQHFRHVIAEFKDEIGSPGADPYHQANLRYLETTRPHAPRLEDSALPCLIVLVIGPFIAFAGAAWNMRPVIQPLSVSLPLHYHDTDRRMRTQVARHLGAFQKANHMLKEYYECLSREANVPCVNVSQLFPYRTHFQGNDGQLVDFEYDEQALEDKLLFFGRFGDDRPICIKFMTQYSKDAHLICASLGCAPILHGFEMLPGGWLMVVMDRLLPEEYRDFYDATPTTALVKNIRGALKKLHQRGYVHGDIHPSNVLVSKRHKTKFMLVDFDWAGRIGEVRYPMNVNRTRLWRPEDAVDGALIRVEHDMDMLGRLAKYKR